MIVTRDHELQVVEHDVLDVVLVDRLVHRAKDLRQVHLRSCQAEDVEGQLHEVVECRFQSGCRQLRQILPAWRTTVTQYNY